LDDVHNDAVNIAGLRRGSVRRNEYTLGGILQRDLALQTGGDTVRQGFPGNLTNSRAHVRGDRRGSIHLKQCNRRGFVAGHVDRTGHQGQPGHLRLLGGSFMGECQTIKQLEVQVVMPVALVVRVEVWVSNVLLSRPDFRIIGISVDQRQPQTVARIDVAERSADR